MKVKRSLTLLPLLVVLVLVLPPSCSTTAPAVYDVRVEGGTTLFEKGSLRYDHGIPVLVVAGTPAQMGLQYGVLLREPLKKSLVEMNRIFGGALEERPWYQRLLFPLWRSWYTRSMGKRIPARYLEELRGIAKGSGLDYDIVLFVATGAGIFENLGCTSALVRTKDGILHGRNLDWMPLFLGSTPLVVEYRPSDRLPYTSFTMVGVPGCIQGINGRGLTLTTNIAFRLRRDTKDNDGMPVMFKNREIMERAGSLAEAERLFSSWHTDELGWMITMSSRDERDGAIFEMFDNRVVRTGLSGDRAYIHNILFDPERLGNAELSGRYTEIHMGLGEYNLSRAHLSSKRFPGVRDVDSMLDYLSTAGLYDIGDLVINDNSGINNPCTINTMVFDSAHGAVYYASAPGLSASSAVYRYDPATGTFRPYREGKPLSRENAAGLALYSDILDLWIMGKHRDIVRRYDEGMDNVPVVFLLAAKSWLKDPSPADAGRLLAGADRHIARHGEYGLYHLLKGEILAASGRMDQAAVELKRAVESPVIAAEDRLQALLDLCRITRGAERRNWMKRYVELMDPVSRTWHVEKRFAGPWKEMKRELE